MANGIAVIAKRKKIALVTHNHKKEDLLDCVRFNKETLLEPELLATGTTGKPVDRHTYS